MDDNSLQINIQAIDEASGVLQGVADEAQSMADDLAASARTANESLGTMGEEAQSMAMTWEESMAELQASMEGIDSSLASVGEQASATATQVDDSFSTMGEEGVSSVQSIEDSMAALNEVMAQDSASISEDALKAGLSFDEAATMIKDSNDQIIASEDEVSGMSGLLGGAGLMALSTSLQQAGAPIKKFYDDAVSDGAAAQQALLGISQSIKENVIQGQNLSNADSDASKQKQFLINQINQEKAQLDLLAVPIQAYNKTTAELNAQEELRAAQIQTTTDKITTLQGQLDRFNNLQDQAKIGAADFAAQMDATARQAVQLGYSYTDSLKALNMANIATGNAKLAILEFKAAMDLAATPAGGGNIVGAVDALNKAVAGNNNALREYGVNIKNGLSGNEVFAAVTAQVAGQAEAQAQGMQGSFNRVNSSWNELMADLGNSQGPMTTLMDKIATVILKIDEWTKNHKQLTQEIMIFLGVLGTALVLFASLLMFIALIAIAVALIGGAWVGLIALLTVAFAAFVATLVTHWTTIKTNAVNAFNGLMDFFKTFWADLVKVFDDAIQKIEQLIDGILAKINQVINGAKSIGASIGGGISSAASGAWNAVTSVLPHFATGGIVDSPTIAMVGEAGPEAIIPLSMLGSGQAMSGLGGGNGGGINVYITGTVMSTDDQAKKLGDAIAKQINRSLKLTSFR